MVSRSGFRRPGPLGVFAALLALCSAGCDGGGSPGGDPGLVQVVCTTGQVADLVENVGGEHVTVTALMGPGVDPHLYKATPGDRRALNGADLIFYNGLHLEGRLAELLDGCRARGREVKIGGELYSDAMGEAGTPEGTYLGMVKYNVETIVEALK